MASGNAIKVVARFRPQNKVEIASGGEPIVSFDSEDTCRLQSEGASGAFTFDRVFDMKSRQVDIFEYSIKSTVDDVMDGYNGTVFAYGQTGAGKSFSMMGGSIDDAEMKGIIPRITEQIFAAIQGGSDTIDWLLKVSYMEIYMEQIRDLLKPSNSNLPIHEEKGKGVYVKGLTDVYVQSADEVYEIMRVGGEARKVASTNMNQESSRSHSIFIINVEQSNRETGSKKSGTLFLVDLAGSEKIGKTGATGQTLEEAKKINKSLSALGMVINALTDGKSSHVPYRDSKLTRILQESLGGNTRTTLIICCSPSSYNDQETLSTLRFGTRAKAIKNKAKVNAELSPAELKNIIKKYEIQNADLAKWIALANPELIRWHTGDQVPKDDWTPEYSSTVIKKLSEKAVAPTPARLKSTECRPETPLSRPESRLDLERAATPSVLDKDERDEFLRRENELQDQLAEKESALTVAEKGFQGVKEELSVFRERDARLSAENQKMTSEINDLQMQLDRIKFDMKEEVISMDSLKEANAELTAELDDLKQQLLSARTAARDSGGSIDEKERLKRERMATMMTGFDLGGELFSDNERSIRKTIEHIDSLSDGESIAPEQLKELRRKLLETQGIVRQAESSVTQKMEQEESAILRRDALEKQLSKVQTEYEALLEGKLSPEDAADVKSRLADSLKAREHSEAERLNELSDDLARKVEENKKLAHEIHVLQERITSGSVANGAPVNGAVSNKSVQQQFAEFEVMKKSLMRDLQNRCERVVELEISLDETREQYNNVLRTSNNRAQQKKMAFLERNLEQLTVVQRQLVEQNSQLKKEAAIAERKLATRTERIRNLENLLHDSQEKLTAASHRFEVQLQSVKERLEAAKAGSTRGLGIGGPAPGQGGFNFASGPRIAKPLRGGGGGAGGEDVQHPGVQGLQTEAGAGKRGSWFFQQRA